MDYICYACSCCCIWSEQQLRDMGLLVCDDIYDEMCPSEGVMTAIEPYEGRGNDDRRKRGHDVPFPGQECRD